MIKILTLKVFLIFNVIIFCMSLTACNRNIIRNVSTENVTLHDIKVTVRIAEADNFGNIYIVTDKNILIKYDQTNTEKYRYANRRTGQITHIDVTNPLKILLFFDDFNYLLILDNTLTEITDLRLEDAGFMDISAAAIANDDNYWVYDPVQFRLVKVNSKGISLVTTSNTNDFGMEGTSVSLIREAGNYVILMDKSRGFFIFDNLGQFVKYFNASGIKYFQYDGRVIYFTSNDNFYAVNIRMGEISNPMNNETSEEKTQEYFLNTPSELIAVYKEGISRIKK